MHFLRHFLLPAALALCGAGGANAALQTGDLAPEVKLQASLAGKAFPYSLQARLKQGPVVVYFYPSAYTNGCNVQARQFALNVEAFAAVGASVVGVSLDPIARLNRFSADPEYCAGKVAVASDVQGKVSKAFDLTVTERSGRKDTQGEEIAHGFVERTTFVIGTDGRIVATIGGVTPTENVQQALQAVRQLAATPPH